MVKAVLQVVWGATQKASRLRGCRALLGIRGSQPAAKALGHTNQDWCSAAVLTLTAPPFLMLPPTKILPANLGCFGSLRVQYKVLWD